MTFGWTEKPLGEIMTLQRGFDLPRKQRREGQIPIISSSGAEDFHSVPAKNGPRVVTGRYGTIGKVFYAEEAYWPLNTTLFVSNFYNNNPRYCYYLLSRFDFQAHSGKTGVPGVNRNDLHSVLVTATTDRKEQVAIAEALSDADALIEGLERLIAKKRLIKQGAMQDLLTAKRRLPGFSGEWVERTLPELAEIRSGGTPSTTIPEMWDGDIAWCTPTDITALKGSRFLSQTSRCITELGLRKSAAELLPTGTIVMTSRATIGECAISTVPISTNQGFKNFIARLGTDRDFLFYLLSAQKTGFIELCSGSTFLEIGMSQLRKYSVRTPADWAEQVALATILADMDSEIQTLDTRLEKARQVKEGMMQNLLTGRIRLV